MENLRIYSGSLIVGLAFGIMLIMLQVSLDCAVNGNSYSNPLLGETIQCEWSK